MLAIFQLINKISFKKESRVPLNDLGHDYHCHEFELQCNVYLRQDFKSPLVAFLPGCKELYMPPVNVSTALDVLIMATSNGLR